VVKALDSVVIDPEHLVRQHRGHEAAVRDIVYARNQAASGPRAEDILFTVFKGRKVGGAIAIVVNDKTLRRLFVPLVSKEDLIDEQDRQLLVILIKGAKNVSHALDLSAIIWRRGRCGAPHIRDAK